MIGCSVGSLIAAYYAAAGRTVEDLLRLALTTDLPRVAAHAVSMLSPVTGRRLVRRWAGPVRDLLAELDGCDFRRLHHGVRSIGFLMHDRRRGERIFAVTGRERGLRLSEAVRASSRLPVLFPPLRKEIDGLERVLVDGAFSAPSPVVHAVAAPVSATHVIAVDLSGSLRRRRWSELERWQVLLGDRLLVLRPRAPFGLGGWGTAPRARAGYEAGRAALGEVQAERLGRWLQGDTAPPAARPAIERTAPCATA